MRRLAALCLLAIACTPGAASEIYSDPWSAAVMLRTTVRGMDRRPIGRVQDLVVGRRYAVPWDVAAGAAPQTLAGPGAWRVSRLLHEHANLRDVPEVAFVRDALFRANGQIDKVLVSNFYETYAYPFYGYREGAGGYALPYASNQMDGLAPASGTPASLAAAR